MSLKDFGGQILTESAKIARKIARDEGTRLRWATVTSVSPLQIRYDGETAASVVKPQTVALVSVGDRVRVAVYKRQATILGVAGGGVGEFSASEIVASTSAGWSLNRAHGLRRGPIVDRSFMFDRTGGTITVFPNGNIPDSTVCTVQDQFRIVENDKFEYPARVTGKYGYVYVSNNRNSGFILAGGSFPGQVIDTGDSLEWRCMYFTA